jgi:hypothetical protein
VDAVDPNADVVATVKAAPSGPQYGITTPGGSAGGDLGWQSGSGGLNSGWVDVEVVVEAGGSVTVTVDGNVVSRTQVPPGTISGVQITSEASTNGSATWRGITVEYYQPGDTEPHDSETLDDHCNPTATNGTSKTVQSTPADSNNTRVVITGQVDLSYQGGSLPPGAQIGGGIHVGINP